MHLLGLLTLVSATSAAVAGGRLVVANRHQVQSEGAQKSARDARLPVADRHQEKDHDKVARDARLPLIANRRTQPTAASTQNVRLPFANRHHSIDKGAAEAIKNIARDARLPLIANRRTQAATTTTSIIEKIARDAVDALSATAPFKADDYIHEYTSYLEDLQKQQSEAGTTTGSGSWPKVTKQVARAVAGAYDQLNSFADGIKQRAAEAELRARAHAAGTHVLDYKRDVETGGSDLDDDAGEGSDGDIYARDTDRLNTYDDEQDEFDDFIDLYARNTDELHPYIDRTGYEDDDYDDYEEQHIARRDPSFYVNHGSGSAHRARDLDVDDYGVDEEAYEGEEDDILEERAEPTETRPYEPVPQPTVYTNAEPRTAPQTTPGHHGHGHWHGYGHGHAAHPAASASQSTETAIVK